MKIFAKLMLTGAVAVGISLSAAVPASAYVVCNKDGDCWHTHVRVRVPGVTFETHPDHWYFHQKWDADRHWRDYHEGRGYYRNGIWMTL